MTTLNDIFSYWTKEEIYQEIMRYRALRQLNPRQFAALCKRNLKGENFDEMVDSLVEKNLNGK